MMMAIALWWVVRGSDVGLSMVDLGLKRLEVHIEMRLFLPQLPTPVVFSPVMLRVLSLLLLLVLLVLDKFKVVLLILETILFFSPVLINFLIKMLVAVVFWCL
jgi:hypothetical protein